MILGGATDATTAGTKSGDAAAKLEDDLNRFLNLLVTQLKNQDPLDPMDSNEFTSQLVQFASVEQQIYQNSNLEKLVNLGQMDQISSLVDFIDKTVEVIGQKFPLENGHGKFTYTMPEGAKSASIIIRDAAGKTVYEQSADTTEGQHTFEWNGLDKNGNKVEDATYTAVVTGLDYNNDILDIAHTVFGRVTGVGVENGEPTLYIGDQEVPQSYILSVKETANYSDETDGGTDGGTDGSDSSDDASDDTTDTVN